MKAEESAVINKERLVASFLEMVKISSPSGKENHMAAYLQEKLEALGLEVVMDRQSALREGFETGNLIARLPANTPGIPPLLFAPHMDTVNPGEGIEPVIRDGIIYSAGDTILGADDKAGVSVAVEVIRHLVEENAPHGELEFVFTYGEETGLSGREASPWI